MQLIKFSNKVDELPAKVQFSVESIVKFLDKTKKKETGIAAKYCEDLLDLLAKNPALVDGIEDLDELASYENELNAIFKSLFPKPLQTNEIKAVIMPFQFVGFHPTERFANILKNAGEGANLDLLNFDQDDIYMASCSFILGAYYKQNINMSRPISVQIPNKVTGQIRNYRVLINGDSMDVIKTDAAPDLSQQDIDELLLNGENIELWREKFPPNSYIFRGFGIVNLFDTTSDFLISQIGSIFLRSDENVFLDFKKCLRSLLNISDLEVGYSLFDTKNHKILGGRLFSGSESIFFNENDSSEDYRPMFCNGVNSCVFSDRKIFALSDVERYGALSGENMFYKKMALNGIRSAVLVPIDIKGELILVLELGSIRKNELNPFNTSVMEEVIPFLKVASERYYEESGNALESTIQEHYTSIHPSVKWRFAEAAESFQKQKSSGIEHPRLDDIVFGGIYPIYGQSDIKGSSTARNETIKADLEFQLSLVVETLRKVMETSPLPIYNKLIFRVESYVSKVQGGLKAGDEVGILDFLKREIYPVFNHLKSTNDIYAAAIEKYMSHIDPKLQVVYKERKAYEDSVTILNDRMAAHIDKRQEEAQLMFPHYFERYKTDGVEYNAYIGASLVDNLPFHETYLYNLRLWQLETMWEVEQIAYKMRTELPYRLEVASLILIHSAPLAIKFRMDEKQFDVDGAYNARYEIVKKRIDKSYIKGTNERLTQPGKIAIVYSQDEDATEYLNYIEYIQSTNRFGKVEMLHLDDLQGLSGLKAIRVEVIYEKEKTKKKKKVYAEVEN